MTLPFTGWKLCVVVGVIVAGASFLAGRSSVPKPDLRRADSLKVTEPAHDSGRRAVRDSTALIEEEIRVAMATIEAERRKAASARAFADLSRRRADSLALRLVMAQSMEDSLVLYPIQVAELRQEGDSLRFANDTLQAGLDTAMAKIGRLQFNVTLLTDQMVRDSVRLKQYVLTVNDLSRAARGCRILGSKCPVVGGDYTPGTKAWGVTVSYPVKDWLHLGVRHEF